MQGHVVKITEGEVHRMFFKKKTARSFFNKDQLCNQ